MVHAVENQDAVPFKGRIVHVPMPSRVLHRFTREGHVAEIRERTVTQFHAIEFLVFVDGSLIESQLFHNGREAAYPAELETRVKQFVDDGWTTKGTNGRD
jgi:hypothetical protein